MIVRSYHTSLPGELSRKWKSPPSVIETFFNQVPTTRRLRRFTFMSLFYTFLQQLGSISPSIQRVILHIVQPLLLSALYFISVILRKHPFSLIGVGILFIIGIYYIISSIYKDRIELEENMKHQESIKVIEQKPIVPQFNNSSTSILPPSVSYESPKNKKNNNNSNNNSNNILNSFDENENKDNNNDDDGNENDDNNNKNDGKNGINDENCWSDEFIERNRRTSSCEDVSSFFGRDSRSNTTLSHRLRLSSIDSSNSDFLIKRSPSDLYTDSSNPFVFPLDEDENNQEHENENENEQHIINNLTPRKIDVNNLPIRKQFSFENLSNSSIKNSNNKKKLLQDESKIEKDERIIQQTNSQKFWESSSDNN